MTESFPQDDGPKIVRDKDTGNLVHLKPNEFGSFNSIELGYGEIFAEKMRELIHDTILANLAKGVRAAGTFAFGGMQRGIGRAMHAIDDLATGRKRMEQFGEVVKSNWKPAPGEIVETIGKGKVEQLADEVKHKFQDQFGKRSTVTLSDSEAEKNKRRYFADIEKRNAQAPKPKAPDEK